jgi:hypothetical protein
MSTAWESLDLSDGKARPHADDGAGRRALANVVDLHAKSLGVEADQGATGLGICNNNCVAFCYLSDS